MDPVVITQLCDRIFELLEEKLQAKGRTLQRRLAYVRRQLPGRAVKAGEVLVTAQSMADDVKLAMKVDAETFSAAYDTLNRHLSELDSAAIRSKKRYMRAAAIATQVLIFVALLYGLLLWRANS